MSPDVLILAGAVLIFAGARREPGSDEEDILSHLTSLYIAWSRSGEVVSSYAENMEEEADWYCVLGSGAGFLSH